MIFPGLDLTGLSVTFTSLKSDVEYSLFISDSNLFLLKTSPTFVINSLSITHFFVFPFMILPFSSSVLPSSSIKLISIPPIYPS